MRDLLRIAHDLCVALAADPGLHHTTKDVLRCIRDDYGHLPTIRRVRPDYDLRADQP